MGTPCREVQSPKEKNPAGLLMNRSIYLPLVCKRENLEKTRTLIYNHINIEANITSNVQLVDDGTDTQTNTTKE